MLSPLASAVDWTGVKEVGGFLGFTHYGTIVDPAIATQSQGISFFYGVSPRLRIGGDLGFMVANSGKDPGTTDIGMIIAPALNYDVISKPSGSLYLSGRPLNFVFQNVSAGSSNAWALGIANVGAGIEAKISKDFGMFFEGDVLDFGIKGGSGASTSTNFGFLFFPAVRFGARMYFGGKA